MLSVLIPTHNYHIVPLVEEIHKQLVASSVVFEIICLDDASEKSFSDENSVVKTLSQVTFLEFNENNGRIKSRQLLASRAQYKWLLFLDADVIPKHDNFIFNYLNVMTPANEVVFGGFAYKPTPPENNRMLRWKYGKSQEEVDAATRNQKPYKVVISANFLIKSDVFKDIYSKITLKGYGLDNYLAALLKENKIKVLHINNEVYHLGIEKSSDYLNKKEEAAKTLLQILKDKSNLKHDNNLLALFMNLKRYKLNHVFAFFYTVFKTTMKKNLLSSNPSIKVMQLYRISYLCFMDLND